MKNLDEGRLKQVLKNVIKAYPITVPATLICIVMSLIMLKYNVFVALVGVFLTVGLVLVSFIIRITSKRKLEDIVNALNSKLLIVDEGEGLKRFPLPVVLFDDNDAVAKYKGRLSYFRLFLLIHIATTFGRRGPDDILGYVDAVMSKEGQ